MKLNNLIVSVLIQTQEELDDVTTKSGNKAGSIGSLPLSDFPDLINDPVREDYNVFDIEEKLRKVVGDISVRTLQHRVLKNQKWVTLGTQTKIMCKTNIDPHGILFPTCSKHKCSMTKEAIMGPDRIEISDRFYRCPFCEQEGRNIRIEVRQFNIVGPNVSMTDEEREEFWKKIEESIELLNGSVI